MHTVQCHCHLSVKWRRKVGGGLSAVSLELEDLSISETGSGKGRGSGLVPLISCAKWLLSKMTQFSLSTHPSSWPRGKWPTPSSTGQQPNARRSTKTAISHLHRRLPEAESDFIRSSGPCRRSCCTRRSRGSTSSAPIAPKTGMHLINLI